MPGCTGWDCEGEGREETSDGDEAEGVSGWGSGRAMACGGGEERGGVGNRDGGEGVWVDSRTLNPVVSGAMIRFD